jgi:hypothetical protein
MPVGRRTLAAGATTLALVGVVAYGIASTTSADEGDEFVPVRTSPSVPGSLEDLLGDGKLVVRGVNSQASRADGPLYELTSGSRPRRVGKLSCKRVAVSSSGAGLCFRVDMVGDAYEAVVFDADYRRVRRFPAEGIPDRARLSPSGRYGAFTSFDPAGAEYYFTTPTNFSTYTRILDVRTGKTVVRLEDVEVTKGGKRIEAKESDLWGVTFADDESYYATLAVGKHHYLIKGDIEAGTAHVLRDRVECPALAPDGRRIAYKRRIGDTNSWRMHVLDLRSDTDVPLAEPRSIDDQPEWLGNDMVAYSDDHAVFAVPADGRGAPRLIARHATSPDYVAE